MQGSVWGSICCVVLMDKLGKLAYNNPALLYLYKGVVGTPPLQMVDDIMAIQKCSTMSLHMNVSINTFIELEKLTLSKKKCHNVHIGKQNKECPALKIHGSKMETSDRETYLGDVLDKTGKARPNIEARKAKGYGIVSEILAITNEIPLGHWKIEAGLKLRQAMLVNGILFNSEAWHGVSTEDLIILEKVDEALLRGLLMAHSKIPLEALFLETNSIPIRIIVASRRLMYLHNILQKESHEMIRKVYEAQKLDTSPGDFCEMVSEDKALIDLNMSEIEIESTKKERFKNIVKQKIRKASFQYLSNLKANHSKMSGITYKTNEISSYLKSPLFNSVSRKLLLALRTRTVEGLRADFKGMYPDTTCPLGCGQEDTLPNILTCSVLKLQHTSNDITGRNIKYEDVFSHDVVTQKQVTELYSQLLDVRTKLMESQPVALTGPVHCS